MNEAANRYQQLLHELGQLRTAGTDRNVKARRALEEKTQQVSAMRRDIDREREALIDTAQQLRAAAPDLRASPNSAASSTIDDDLRSARNALTRATNARSATLRAGQSPPLLPGGHHFVRNLIVYGIAMAICFAVQLLLAWLTTTKVLPSDLELWTAFIPPVLFLIAGWIATGFAGTPRIPVTDAQGKAIDFTVYKSPRLGAVLAVLTITGFLIVAWT